MPQQKDGQKYYNRKAHQQLSPLEPDVLIYYLRRACVEVLNRGTIDAALKNPLRPTQHEGFEAFAAFLGRTDLPNAEKLSGYLEMPTGVGKTAFFGALIERVSEYARADGHVLRVGVVAPKINLLRHTQKNLQKFFPMLRGQIGLYGGNDREKDKPITVITYDSWVNLTDQGKLGSKSFDLLISDEAHRGTSEKRERYMQSYVGVGRYALTATAHYDPLKTVQNTHGNRIFEKHVAASVKDGELADYVQVQLHVIRVLMENDEDDPKRAKQLAFNQFVAGILETGKDKRTGDPLTDNQVGVYVEDTAQADHLEELLNSTPALQEIARQRGCKAFAVSIHTNGMANGEQHRRDEDYKKGCYLCRIGDELFKEGDDHPPMKVVIDMRHQSLVDKAQILGRGARYWYNEAKGRSEGLTVIDTISYLSCEPDEIKGIDLRQAMAIEKRNRRNAIANAITAIDVLDGNVEITSYRARSPGGARPPPPGPKPFQGLEVTSYTTIEDLKTYLAERDQLRLDIQQSKKANLTANQIQEWIAATRQKTGKYPSDNDQTIWTRTPVGDYEVVPDETWHAISEAFHRGYRGLVNEDGSPIANSLSEFRKQCGLIEPHELKPDLTGEQLRGWLIATKEKTGKYPDHHDKTIWSRTPGGDYEIVPDETWTAIENALRDGRRGLINEDGSLIANSLSEFRKQCVLIEPHEIKHDLTEKQLRAWVIATKEKTGRSPSELDPTVWSVSPDGEYEIVRGITWRVIDRALRNGKRGLINKDGSPISKSLSDFKKRLGIAKAKPSP